MRIGVILARFQPIHKGHVELIKKASSENDKVILLVGSADKLDERNPIPIKTRMNLVRESLIESKLDKTNISIYPLNDLTNESDNSYEWGFYIYAKVVRLTGSSDFTMYYSDGYEIITTWFPKFLLREYVSLSLISRGNTSHGVSATQVRDHIVLNKSLKGLVPECVDKERDILHEFIRISKSR